MRQGRRLPYGIPWGGRFPFAACMAVLALIILTYIYSKRARFFKYLAFQNVNLAGIIWLLQNGKEQTKHKKEQKPPNK